MREWLKLLALVFWSLRYRIYNRDLYAGLRARRGTKDNPLTMEDMAPTMLMMRRLNPS